MYMKPYKKTLAAAALLCTFFSANHAVAKPGFPAAQPISYNNAISCSSCHTAGVLESENTVSTAYGRTFNSYINDDLPINAASYTSIEHFDSDQDGFSNIQEIVAGSRFNTASSTPLLIGAITSGVVSAKPALNETITLDKVVPTTPTSVVVPVGQKNIGGTVDFSMTNLTAVGVANTGTPTFMFSTGGVQTGAIPYFIGNNNVATVIPGAVINTNGSITLSITDEGPYDLYSSTNYIATATSRTPSISPYATVSPYASVSPYAVVSDYATINAYATVGAYALIDTYATVDTYAVIDAYVTVAANTTVPANTTVAIPTTFTGTIKSRMAVVTPTPALPAFAGGEGGGTTGGLHCMTSGLATQGLMVFALLMTGLFLRRKKA